MKNFTFLSLIILLISACDANQTSAVSTQTIPSKEAIPLQETATQTRVPTSIAIPTMTSEQILDMNQNELLAFSANIPMKSGIYMLSSLAETPQATTNLIDGQTFYSSPSWSPSGGEIAFTLEDAFGPKIFIVKPDSKSMKLLTQGLSKQQDPAWSPDGDQIAFVSEADLYTIKVNGSHLQRLISGVKPLFPTWSPDGQKIAFLSFDGTDGKDYQIHIINKDGSDLQTPTTKIASFSRISWSPDGQKIVFGVIEPCWDLAILDLTTGNITQLTDTPSLERDPAWSPDGELIAYAFAPFSSCEGTQFRNAVNGPFDIYLMSKDGKLTRQLTSFSEGASQPAWWPVVILQPNWKYRITRAGSDLNVRESSSLSAKSLIKLHQGEVFTALEGPVDAGNYYWWRIRTEDGTEGWIVDIPGWYMFQSAP